MRLAPMHYPSNSGHRRFVEQSLWSAFGIGLAGVMTGEGDPG